MNSRHPHGSRTLSASRTSRTEAYEGRSLKISAMRSGNGQFNYSSGVTVDGSGNVYVADNLNHRIQKFHLPVGEDTCVISPDPCSGSATIR